MASGPIYISLMYALSAPHFALMHHRLAMLHPPHPHQHWLHPRHHIGQHHWFPGQPNFALSPPHFAVIHHPLAMLLPAHPHLHHRHPGPHTCRHHWLPGETTGVQLWPVITGWRRGCHCFRHQHLRNPCCPLASPNAVCHPCNCCTS